MGYRSEVVLTVKKECFDKHKEDIKEIVSFCDDLIYIKEHDIYLIKWDHIKWYDSYPEVQAVEKFRQTYPEDTSFTRIGEEIGDIESSFNGYEYDIYVTRSIAIPSGDEVDKDELFKKEETV